MKSLSFITLHVLMCDFRARPRAHALLYTSHPAPGGDIVTRHHLPSVGFQRSFYPFCECLSGPHRVSDSSFTGFHKFKKLQICPVLFLFALFEVLSSILLCETDFHRNPQLSSFKCSTAVHNFQNSSQGPWCAIAHMVSLDKNFYN